MNLDEVQTNIFMMEINNSIITSKDFTQRLAQIRNEDPYKICVRASSRNVKSVRFVTQWEHSEEDIELAIKKILYIIKEFDNKLKNKL